MRLVQGVWWALYAKGGIVGGCGLCSAISDGCAVCWLKVIGGEGKINLVPFILWGAEGGSILACITDARVGHGRRVTGHIIGVSSGAGVGDKGTHDNLPYGRDDSAGSECDNFDAANNILLQCFLIIPPHSFHCGIAIACPACPTASFILPTPATSPGQA